MRSEPEQTNATAEEEGDQLKILRDLGELVELVEEEEALDVLYYQLGVQHVA